MSTKIVYRKWLEPITHMNNKSFVLAELAETNASYDTHSLTLGDCYKHITLEFDADKKNRKKALAKLTKIQDALNILWGALENE